MINYTFNISEEIARWVTEVYIREQQSFGWWVSFTNPIAGPWKKITAPNNKGIFVEVYRFEREGERPDLVLVNDKYKLIIIVEAKDTYQKIISSEQMNKSVRVVSEISLILSTCDNENWAQRKTYKILPSFLWHTENPDDILDQDKIVKEVFIKCGGLNSDDLLNIVVSRDINNNLFNNFVFKNKIMKDLIF